MKDIPEFEGLYAITKEGKIWSYGNRNGVGHKGKFINPNKDKDGYHKIILSNKKPYTRRVARLVLLTYDPPKSNNLQVNHKNGIKTDDRLSNLEWVTPSQNIKHSFNVLNKNQKCNKNNSFKPWGYIKNNITTLISDKSINSWCNENNIKSTTIHTSIKENRELKKGRFKGYKFFHQ